MELTIQIQSFIFSFVFGFLFSYLVNLSYKYLFSKKIYVQVIWNFLIVIGSCLLYFFGMKAINHAVLHIYFYIMVILGYLIGNLFSRKTRRY